MTIHRVNKTSRYTTICNEAFTNKDLSLKAKGILAYLLTKPDGWECRTEDIVANSSDGRGAVLAGLKELEAIGYLCRYKTRDESGLIQHRSEIFESLDARKEWEALRANKTPQDRKSAQPSITPTAMVQQDPGMGVKS